MDVINPSTGMMSTLCCEKECAPPFGDKDDCEFYIDGKCTAKTYVKIDPTGVQLTPSFHGEECLGTGEHPGVECCCDECPHYLISFPEFDQ